MAAPHQFLDNVGRQAALRRGRCRRLGSPGWPVGVAEPTCSMRGASPACCTFMPKSIMFTSTCDVPLRLHVAAHHAEDEPRLAVLRDHGRDDRVERPLVRLQAVGVLLVEGEQACRGFAGRSRDRPAPGRSRSPSSCSGSATRNCGPCPPRRGRSCRSCRASGRRRSMSVSALSMSISLRRSSAYGLRDQLARRAPWRSRGSA